MEVTKFNASEETRNAIRELLDDLLRVCKIAGVPMYATVAVASDEEGTEYLTVIRNPASHNEKLKEDRIRKHMLIADGFEAVPPREVITADPFEEIRRKMDEGDQKA